MRLWNALSPCVPAWWTPRWHLMCVQVEGCCLPLAAGLSWENVDCIDLVNLNDATADYLLRGGGLQLLRWSLCEHPPLLLLSVPCVILAPDRTN